jgi:hypothetical protein
LKEGEQIEDRFEGEDYRLMVVANKFQTGFDQPLLAGLLFSSHPSSIAKWQLGPAPTREKHRSESSLATISPSIGQGTFHLAPNQM